MKQIKNEKELIKILTADIKNTTKKNIVFLAGHFPFVYSNKDIEAIKQWGIFSVYTWELACKLADVAKKIGKNVGFVIFVDDHMYKDFENAKSYRIKTMRRQLYKLRSGATAQLPELFRKKLIKYGFDESNIIRHDHKKFGRRDCLYFSESVLRSSKRNIDNDCAREYVEFIEDEKYFDKNNSYLISFIPRRCQANICVYALGAHVKDLRASHVFLESMIKGEDPNDFYTCSQGVYYQKN
jgi:hypothetical protein